MTNLEVYKQERDGGEDRKLGGKARRVKEICKMCGLNEEDVGVGTAQDKVEEL